jgi:hypothetical protein
LRGAACTGGGVAEGRGGGRDGEVVVVLFLLLAAGDPVLDSPHVERPRLAWVPFDGIVVLEENKE